MRKLLRRASQRKKDRQINNRRWLKNKLCKFEVFHCKKSVFKPLELLLDNYLHSDCLRKHEKKREMLRNKEDSVEKEHFKQ